MDECNGYGTDGKGVEGSIGKMEKPTGRNLRPGEYLRIKKRGYHLERWSRYCRYLLPIYVLNINCIYIEYLFLHLIVFECGNSKDAVAV